MTKVQLLFMMVSNGIKIVIDSCPVICLGLVLG